MIQLEIVEKLISLHCPWCNWRAVIKVISGDKKVIREANILLGYSLHRHWENEHWGRLGV
jgi:hypothetical protein